MERLLRNSKAAMTLVEGSFYRPIYQTIGWEDHATGLIGARGVGKTTLMLQRMRELGLPHHQALYVDLGDVYFQENRLLDFAMEFVDQGGRYLFIDEVHRYGHGSWAQEIKQIYDLLRNRLKITFTGSSALRMIEQNADLSRRALLTRVPGLSLREFIQFTQGITLPVVPLDDLLNRSQQIVPDLLRDHPDFRAVEALNLYCQTGYYPFHLLDTARYRMRLNEIIQIVLQTDIPSAVSIDRINYQQISRLLFAIASSAPFKPNITKLSQRLGSSRQTLLQYLEYLERGQLISTLRSETRGVAAIGKPDKVYLQNTNLLYALAPNQLQKGTIRETFFLSQLQVLTWEAHIVPPEIRLPKTGDFALLRRDGERFLFEVGGPNKTHRQIGQHPNHYVVVDTQDTSGEQKIPLWLFGLLY